jgi:hypothetical protein
MKRQVLTLDNFIETLFTPTFEVVIFLEFFPPIFGIKIEIGIADG